MADKKEEKKDNTEARLTSLEAKMRKVLKAAEIHFGKDVDGDGKQGSARVWVLALISVVALGTLIGFAAQNAETGDKFGDVDGGVFRIRANGDYDTDGGFVGAGALSGSAVTATGAATIGSLIDGSVSAAVDTTNGQAMVLSGFMLDWNAIGGANASTSTVTITKVAAGLVGSVWFGLNTGTTNSIDIESTGTYDGPAIVVGAGEMFWIYAKATNSFYGGSFGDVL